MANLRRLVAGVAAKLGARGEICPECQADRWRRYDEARAANGLTEDEWPRPEGPRYIDLAGGHRRRAHGR